MSPSLAAQLESSRRLAEETCVDAQRMSHRLHPSQLAVLGLTKALSGLCEAFARQTGAPRRCHPRRRRDQTVAGNRDLSVSRGAGGHPERHQAQPVRPHHR